jgi:predicted DNA-binding transcriptional regulator AlpA
MRNANSAALANFDDLPASAGVRLPVVATIFGVSPATVWRWSKKGVLPTPYRVGHVTLWNVQQLRECLAGAK